ncbi:hypothetical protein EMCRGX_G023052 [Ephydatia muelleri]
MTELVKQNLLEAQRKQKTWYDSHARSLEFRDGDLVLVLLPSSSNKLLAQWQGPYQVLRRCEVEASAITSSLVSATNPSEPSSSAGPISLSNPLTLCDQCKPCAIYVLDTIKLLILQQHHSPFP